MKKNQNRILFLLVLVMLTVLASAVFVCAADSTPPATTTADAAWSGIWGLLTMWLIRIGAGLALFGAVNIAISLNSDNPDARARGLNSLAAGLLLMAIGASPQIFGVL